MIIIPAIDLKDGHCVRLRQGRAEDSTIYSDDPVEMALKWVAEGAAYLHLVDLDGAFQGKPVHAEIIRRIVKAIPVPVEVGGGIRTDEDIAALLACGVNRVILGTRAFSDPKGLARLAGEFHVHLAVGIDARDGIVQIKGWKVATGLPAADLASVADKAGIKTIIYTDVATDGMLKGANVEAVGEICDQVSCGVVASGGVSSVEDVRRLRDLGKTNLTGCIVGKALYEGRVRLKALLGAAGGDAGKRPVC